MGILELSSDYLISAAADSSLKIWDPTNGDCLTTLVGHSAPITCFHHDVHNNRIVSGSDGGVKIWELNSSAYPTWNIPQNMYRQGPNGLQPVYGRFLADAVTNVRGVWRVSTDERRLVCAVQKEQEQSWFEVLDFAEGPEIGQVIDGVGDSAMEEDEETAVSEGEELPSHFQMLFEQQTVFASRLGEEDERSLRRSMRLWMQGQSR